MSLGCKTQADVTKAIKDNGIQIIDVKFTDLFGQWHHFSVPAEEYSAAGFFREGLGFDGSSIRGFQAIEQSDMVLRADPTTALLDPICEHPTLSLIVNVHDPITGEAYSRDPRNVARKSLDHLKKTKIADAAYFGPEAEFFIFDEVAYESGRASAGFDLDSAEAPWAGAQPGGGHVIPHLGGYFPVAPYDQNQDLRSEMVRTMIAAGIDIEVHHHEVATAGQAEIDMRYAPMIQMADQVQLYKYITKNVARRYGKTVTFMPKPIFEDNGSGMHTHQSLWKNGKPLFAGKEYAGLSKLAMNYAGGILKHINAILAFAGAPDELVQAVGAGLRGSGRRGDLRAQPLGRPASPGVLGQSQGEADRVPLSRPRRQPLPRLRGDDDGGPGRDQE